MNHITKTAEIMTEWLEIQLKQEASLTDIEQLTRDLVQQIGREVVRMSLQRQAMTYPENTVECECGGQAHYLRRRKAKLHTLFGQVEVMRAYYL